MDKAALGLAMEQHIPIVICDLLTDGNIARVARVKPSGRCSDNYRLSRRDSRSCSRRLIVSRLS